ncbi:hypothetical protein NP233_g4671 [Leucocoprinus birnbaumii]|uniref:Uncharacterized protein n=1 Tax=Leucocoprinus birnbaumii TaxID=56174 RepID=A0AAD5W0Q4_9AGAR|nr:hypothetical protein NP233_g4671 [Leucocoprinus birnbaumii]
MSLSELVPRDKRRCSPSGSPISGSGRPVKKFKSSNGIDTTSSNALFEDKYEQSLSRYVLPQSAITAPMTLFDPAEPDSQLSSSSALVFPASPDSNLTPYERRMVRLNDNHHINRLKRLASRFRIYDWMFFKDETKLENLNTDPQPSTPGTRTQLIADVLSWIQNPQRTGNVLGISGSGASFPMGSVYQVVKHSNPSFFLRSPTTFRGTNHRASCFSALITLTFASYDHELAEFIESQTSQCGPDNLPSPQSLFSVLHRGLRAFAGAQRPYVIMLGSDILEDAPEVLQFIFGAQASHLRITILWILRSQNPLTLHHGPFVSMPLQPLTYAEKEIILRKMQEPHSGAVEQWSGGEPLLLPVHAVESFLLSSHYPSTLDNFWEENDVPEILTIATSYLDSFRSLALLLNQSQKQGIDGICSFRHPFEGQYLPLVSLANSGDLGVEQFVLVMVLVVHDIGPTWAECTHDFFLKSFYAFRDGTLEFLELVQASAFRSLFFDYNPRDSLDLRLKEVLVYLEERFHHLIQPISNLALIPPLIFAYLSALGTRPIDRVSFAVKTYIDFDAMHFRSSLVYLHQDIHKGLWEMLPTVTFWDDPAFLNHFALVLPQMRFHTHSIPVKGFLNFIFHFKDRKTPTPFVRIQASSTLDQELIDACGSIARALDFEAKSFDQFKKFLDDGEARYTLLGSPADPVLSIVVKKVVTLYTHAELTDLS